MIAYNSFAKEAPPPSNTVFAKAPDAGSEVICRTERRDFKKVSPRGGGDNRHFFRAIGAIRAVEFSQGFVVR